MWLIVHFQIKGTNAYSFAYGFGTTAPICIILGSIMLIVRLYPVIIKFMVKISWRKPKLGIFGLSTLRSLRRKGAAIRSLVLISLTFTLVIASMTTVASYDKYDTEQAYYQLGADIFIKNVKVSNDNIKEKVLAVEGVQAGTYVKLTSQIVTFGESLYSYLVIGIDPSEFIEVAYFEKNYIGKDPAEFFNLIQDENDVVMQKDQLAQFQLDVGNQMTIRAEKYMSHGLVNYTVDIVGEYSYFPRFFTTYPATGTGIYRFSLIGLYSLVNELAYSTMNIYGDMLVKVANGYSIAEVANKIEAALGRTVNNVEGLTNMYEGSLRNTMLYGSLNSSFIFSLIITISALSLMIIIQSIENEMEIGMLKILGISPKQLFSLFTIEALTIVLFGSILGLGVGIFTAKMFLEILTIDNFIPPVRLIFPPGQIIIASFALFATALLAAALTSGIIFRKDTIKGIKQL